MFSYKPLKHKKTPFGPLMIGFMNIVYLEYLPGSLSEINVFTSKSCYTVNRLEMKSTTLELILWI